MMIRQDAGAHGWAQEEKWDLAVTMDDATSEIYGAFFACQESGGSSFRGVREVLDKKRGEIIW